MPLAEAARRGRLWRQVVIACCAGLAGVAIFTYLTGGGAQVRASRAFYGDLERLAIAAGFGINQVSLSGHRYTLEDDIFDALDLPNMHSFLSFDPVVLRERLQRLPWIKTVEAARIYPGQLKIRVTERRPAAVWERGEQDYLIDAGGRVLAALDRGVLRDLPRLRGEGAHLDVEQLFALLERFPSVAENVTVAERVGERRWTLHLNRGGAIHLPPGQESAVLASFLAHSNSSGLIAEGSSRIDLRAPGRITIRPQHPTPPADTRGRELG